ncbi:MAG: acyltransferase, partial [Cellulomonas sp.]|nr:acyltransferase [Cellulomonas sp.]
MIPSVRQVTEATPAKRDRFVDVVRLFSLLVVIGGHGVMLMVVFGPDRWTFGNVLDSSTRLQAATWLLQVMPLFFFAGTAASLLSYRGTDAARWLFRRVQRLYRPVFYYLAGWVTVLLVARRYLPDEAYDNVAGVGIQLTWFLGAYMLVLLGVPLLHKIRTARAMWTTVACLVAVFAAIDQVRIADGPQWIGYLNFAAWYVAGVLGVGYSRRLVRRQTALAVGLGALVVNLALVGFGPYEVSLVTVPSQQLSNMTPPSVVLCGHMLFVCGLAIWAQPAITRFASDARVWWFVAIGNRGAMTLYLWHLVALIVVFAVSHQLGYDRHSTDQPHFWWLVAVQVVALYALTSVLFWVLQPLENTPIRWWDAKIAPLSRGRQIGAWVGLVAIVATNLMSAKEGLKGPGLVWVPLFVVALLATRAVMPASQGETETPEVGGRPDPQGETETPGVGGGPDLQGETETPGVGGRPDLQGETETPGVSGGPDLQG